MVLALIVAVLILGWAVMRSPTEIEEEAEQARLHTKWMKYSPTEEYLAWINTPPLHQVYCPKKNAEAASGYVRPLRRRR